ncbi:MAG: hypothetical protein M1817_001599 [Caeruleum heppii]|nr:MAG: hypothetical protein M1817_001599 [Caeruleum heppii]
MGNEHLVRSIAVNGHTRQQHGILTPTCESFLNRQKLPNPSVKRKRDGDQITSDLGDAFVIRSHPSSTPEKPRILKPALVLSRQLLPLSSLDVGSISSRTFLNRLFSARIAILEDNEDGTTAPRIVIAKEVGTERHYAVERVITGIYALCRLGSWVDIDQLGATAEQATWAARKRRAVRQHQDGVNWWETAVLDLALPESTHLSQRETTCRIDESQMVMGRPLQAEINEPVVKIEDCDKEEEISLLQSPAALAFEGVESAPAPDIAPLQDPTTPEPDPQETFEMIRAQYLDALYLQKTSLAYFAKGPLSRARATFNMGYDSPLAAQHLSNFLIDSVLSLSLMDKKYRDTIPAQVASFPAVEESDDEAALPLPGKKKRKSKKRKPAKNGLYSHEEAYLAKWWRRMGSQDREGQPMQTRDEREKSKIAELRTRETELQIILILEILALRVSTSVPDVDDVQAPSQVLEKSKREKTKEKKNLEVILELSLDRLCIWQSVGQEDSFLPSTTTACPTASLKERGGRGSGALKAGRPTRSDGNDGLRDFCTEVILPFFSARLPEQSAAVCRKLGAPAVPSPIRPSLNKAASTSKISQPGAVTRRRPPERPRRTLERVLTDEKTARTSSRRPSAAPSLQRSMTAPAVPGLKRETSETPSMVLASISASRGGVLKSKRFSQREVDITAGSSSGDAKAKMKGAVENELKEAITALKKPNRGLVARSYVDSCEMRTQGATKSRKSRMGGAASQRGMSGLGVQVMATPKNNRKKDMLAMDDPAHGLSTGGSRLPLRPVFAPLSIPSMIVRSVENPFQPDEELRVPASVARKSALAPVLSTPPRPCWKSNLFPSKATRLGEAGEVIEHFGRSEMQQIPASMPRVAQMLEIPARTCEVQETPSKRQSKRPPSVEVVENVAASPRKVAVLRGEHLSDSDGRIEGTSGSRQVSIYASLGWDDEADDLV